MTHDNLAVAAGHSVDPSRWLGMLDELVLQIGARFRRVEPRRRARAFVVGLLAADQAPSRSPSDKRAKLSCARAVVSSALAGAADLAARSSSGRASRTRPQPRSEIIQLMSGPRQTALADLTWADVSRSAGGGRA